MSEFESCLYVGEVRHRRREPVEHAFTYRVFQLYLDLDELDRVFERRWLWSTARIAPAWFRRADFLGDASVPLHEAVRDRVQEETGRRPGGPIRVLTHLRYFGLSFNPVSFYYCFREDGRTLDTIVAEICNTPWNQRHSYVLPVRDDGAQLHRFRFPKAFHVSPFMPMDLGYDWRFSEPGDSLAVSMSTLDEGRETFGAHLALERRPITGRNLAAALARHPVMTAEVLVGIYTQALRLRWKGAPAYVHPDKRVQIEGRVR